jgi:hypothetical protein
VQRHSSALRNHRTRLVSSRAASGRFSRRGD